MSIERPYLKFMGHAAGFRAAISDLTLRKAWAIDPRELSPIAIDLLDVLAASSQSELPEHRQAIWLSQALLEFQDLQPFSVPERGPFLKVHFAFIEALAAFRSSVLSAIGGQVHAALSVLRSGLELFVFHYWWRKRLERKESFHEFYAWLCAEKNGQPFKQILDDVYRDLDLPAEANGKAILNEAYRKLCSYAHKPTMDESLVRIRGTNVPGAYLEELAHWLKIFVQTLNPLLDLSIANAPQALFPVATYRKFGFSGPVGLFFDQSNFIPVQEALGIDRLSKYRMHYEQQETVRTLLEWINNNTDLTDEEVLDSWPDEPIDDENLDFEERVFHRITQIKAHQRALTVGLTYSVIDVELCLRAVQFDHEPRG